MRNTRNCVSCRCLERAPKSVSTFNGGYELAAGAAVPHRVDAHEIENSRRCRSRSRKLHACRLRERSRATAILPP